MIIVSCHEIRYGSEVNLQPELSLLARVDHREAANTEARSCQLQEQYSTRADIRVLLQVVREDRRKIAEDRLSTEQEVHLSEGDHLKCKDGQSRYRVNENGDLR